MPSPITNRPLYTHFEKLAEAPTHTFNLFLGGKAITTVGFRPHPPTWPGAGMGKVLLLAGSNNHMADKGLSGWRLTDGTRRQLGLPSSPRLTKVACTGVPKHTGPCCLSSKSELATYGGMFCRAEG